MYNYRYYMSFAEKDIKRFQIGLGIAKTVSQKIIPWMDKHSQVFLKEEIKENGAFITGNHRKIQNLTQ